MKARFRFHLRLFAAGRTRDTYLIKTKASSQGVSGQIYGDFYLKRERMKPPGSV